MELSNEGVAALSRICHLSHSANALYHTDVVVIQTKKNIFFLVMLKELFGFAILDFIIPVKLCKRSISS